MNHFSCTFQPMKITPKFLRSPSTPLSKRSTMRPFAIESVSPCEISLRWSCSTRNFRRICSSTCEKKQANIQMQVSSTWFELSARKRCSFCTYHENSKKIRRYATLLILFYAAKAHEVAQWCLAIPLLVVPLHGFTDILSRDLLSKVSDHVDHCFVFAAKQNNDQHGHSRFRFSILESLIFIGTALMIKWRNWKVRKNSLKSWSRERFLLLFLLLEWYHKQENYLPRD